MQFKPSRREWGIFTVLALMIALVWTRGMIAQPGYTDAYYHFTAANRLASGDGLTDPYLWTYINAPESLAVGEVVPSHTYWMPLTSLTLAFGMWVLNAPDNYYAAQWPFTLMLVGTACVGFWLGGKIGGSRRHAWVAGLLTLFSGFFVRFWGAADTFVPYSLVGSLALVFIGLGIESLEKSPDEARSPFRLVGHFVLAGIFTGLGHLTRADGLLLLIVGWIVILWPFRYDRTRYIVSLQNYAISLFALSLGYLLIMSPWFLRNLDVMGSPLPVGGFQAAWFTEYNDLFSYPADASPQIVFADGIGLFIEARWTALISNFGTFIAVEGLVVMAPLMLIGLWNRRRGAFLRGFWLYALGLHFVMTLVFPFPGYRGGLFHSAAALVPFWAALGVVGLDDAIDWMAKRRRAWKPRTAKPIFSVGLVLLAIFLSLNFAGNGRVSVFKPALYSQLEAVLPSDSRVMINDPAALYYFTGLSGVVMPNESPEVISELGQRYNITHVLIEYSEQNGQRAYAVPSSFIFDLDTPPPYLVPVDLNISNARLYAIRPG